MTDRVGLPCPGEEATPASLHECPPPSRPPPTLADADSVVDLPRKGNGDKSGSGVPLDVVQVLLNGIYTSAVSTAIRLPDERGAFPPAQWPLHLFPVPPLVADANVLRNDILYACRHDQRTSLVTATNAGVLRLFCASHVPEEVEEHAAEWAADGGVDLCDFVRRWRTHYMPLLRCVSVPYELLTDLEVRWMDALDRVDPDDVPSAVLARLLGAFYLSEDGPALRAVYGPGVDTRRHHAWLRAIRSGSDNAELTGVMSTAFIFLALLGQGIYEAGKKLYSIHPLVLLAAAGASAAGAYTFWRNQPERVQRISSGAWSFLESLTNVLAQIVIYASECEATFAVMFPTVPRWEELTTTHDGERVLARYCLHALAREPVGHLSAAEMHEKLPFSITGQEEAVQEVFREYDCFEQVGLGRWQVGGMWPPFPKSVTVVHASESHARDTDSSQPRSDRRGM